MTDRPKRPARSAAKHDYRALVGISYPDPEGSDGAEKRVETGEIASDLPTSSIEDLLAIGAIEEVAR